MLNSVSEKGTFVSMFWQNQRARENKIKGYVMQGKIRGAPG